VNKDPRPDPADYSERSERYRIDLDEWQQQDKEQNR
jgi:hypothetical protein